MVNNTLNKSDIFSYKSVFQKTGLIIIYIPQKFLYAVCYGFSCDLVVAIEKSYRSPPASSLKGEPVCFFLVRG